MVAGRGAARVDGFLAVHSWRRRAGRSRVRVPLVDLIAAMSRPAMSGRGIGPSGQRQHFTLVTGQAQVPHSLDRTVALPHSIEPDRRHGTVSPSQGARLESVLLPGDAVERSRQHGTDAQGRAVPADKRDAQAQPRYDEID